MLLLPAIMSTILPFRYFTICRARVCLNFTHIRSCYAQQQHRRLFFLFLSPIYSTVATRSVCVQAKESK